MGRSADMASVAAPGTTPLAALEVRDPSDVRALVAEVPAMSAPEVAAAYERARDAFSAWRRANPLDRAAVMSACAGLIRSRAERGSRDPGPGERQDARRGPGARWPSPPTSSTTTPRSPGSPGARSSPTRAAGTQTTVRSEPVGVVLAITPWNDPLLTPARKLGPALIAGNAVLLKPARQTPLIAQWLAGLLAEAGLPGGVLTVVTGRERDISEALLGAPGTGRPDLHRLDGNRRTCCAGPVPSATSGCRPRPAGRTPRSCWPTPTWTWPPPPWPPPRSARRASGAPRPAG